MSKKEFKIIVNNLEEIQANHDQNMQTDFKSQSINDDEEVVIEQPKIDNNLMISSYHKGEIIEESLSARRAKPMSIRDRNRKIENFKKSKM